MNDLPYFAVEKTTCFDTMFPFEGYKKQRNCIFSAKRNSFALGIMVVVTDCSLRPPNRLHLCYLYVSAALLAEEGV